MIKPIKTTVLLIALLSLGSICSAAQGKCPDSMEEEAFKKCWIKEAKSGNKNLRGAYLVNADFQNADLSNADLTNAQTQNANFSGANLSGANLTKAALGSADLTNADFTDAIFIGTNFLGGGAKIGGAKIDLTPLQCRVSTNGESLNTEASDGTVYGSLKNGTIVYRNGNNQPWDKGRISVNEIRGNELVDVGLVNGKFLTCKTPTQANGVSVIQCKLRMKGAALNARTPEGKAKFRIMKNTPVFVFERKNGKAKVGVFNDDNEKWKGWIPDKYLVCDGD